MIEAPKPDNENDRLQELKSLSILDTLEEEDFDNLTELASQICGTPIALVSLIDENRQWFKSHHGLPVSEAPRKYSLCAHAINDPENILVVPDSRKDHRFHDNPFVVNEPKAVFYAGVPLVTESGMALGTLCVMDLEPRVLSEKQLKSLSALSGQVVNLLKLRKRELQLGDTISVLTSKNEELEKFAFIAAHDLSSPLKNISSLTEMLIANHSSKMEADAAGVVELIGLSAAKLRELIDGLLNYSKNESIISEQKNLLDIDELKSFIHTIFCSSPANTIEWNCELKSIYTNKTALHQILINLISNALKHTDRNNVKIEIGITEKDGFYHLYVKDNGPGIKPKYHKRIFDIFTTLPSKVMRLVPTNGIGLATVKKLIESLGGEIYVESDVGLGATFYLSLKK